MALQLWYLVHSNLHLRKLRILQVFPTLYKIHVAAATRVGVRHGVAGFVLLDLGFNILLGDLTGNLIVYRPMSWILNRRLFFGIRLILGKQCSTRIFQLVLVIIRQVDSLLVHLYLPICRLVWWHDALLPLGSKKVLFHLLLQILLILL